MQPVIMTVKHLVHQSLATIASGAISNIDVVNVVVAPAAANSNEVQEGSILKAVYIEMWVTSTGTTGQTCSFNMTVEKVPSDATDMTFTQSANLGAYPNKKNIFYTTQGVVGASVDGSNSIPLYRQWIKIPKGKQRMGLGDKILLNINAIGTTLAICGIFIYKEYR